MCWLPFAWIIAMTRKWIKLKNGFSVHVVLKRKKKNPIKSYGHKYIEEWHNQHLFIIGLNKIDFFIEF